MWVVVTPDWQGITKLLHMFIKLPHKRREGTLMGLREYQEGYCERNHNPDIKFCRARVYSMEDSSNTRHNPSYNP